MCLTPNLIDKEVFQKRNKNKKKIIVWKVVTAKCMTPHRFIKVTSGWFKATGQLQKNEYDNIGSGAIHVYTSRQQARDMKWNTHKILRCTARVKDLVGINQENKTAAFTKIWIPKSELSHVKK